MPARIARLLAHAPLVFLALAVTLNPPSRARADDRPREVKVAAIQCSSELGEVKVNVAKLTPLIREAANAGAKIVVLPETAITGYLSQDLKTNWRLPDWPIDPDFHGKHPADGAEHIPGPSTDYFCNLAKELQIYLTIPLLERAYIKAEAENDNYYNTVCLAAPTGELVAHYRKLTPWPRPEKSWATAGDRGVQTYDTEYGRVGLAICFDIHTILEKYEPLDIWALLYPIAWVDEKPADWFWHRLPKRLEPFDFYVIGANWSVDQPEKWQGYGYSGIYAPHGKLLASASTLYGSQILYATIPTQWAGEGEAPAEPESQSPSSAGGR
jgi:predicted amidohydrolase